MCLRPYQQHQTDEYKPGYNIQEYNSARDYNSAGVRGEKHDQDHNKFKNPFKTHNSVQPIGTPIVYNVSCGYKDIETKRHNMTSPGKFRIYVYT